jgi:hypothetical protein
MKVIVSFIEDNGNPDYPITRHIFPISDPARTVHITPVNSGFGYDTIIVNVPRPAPKCMVKKCRYLYDDGYGISVTAFRFATDTDFLKKYPTLRDTAMKWFYRIPQTEMEVEE